MDKKNKIIISIGICIIIVATVLIIALVDSMTEDKRVRLSYKGLPPYFQFGIKTICEICLKHPEDYSKLDIKLLKDILKEVS